MPRETSRRKTQREEVSLRAGNAPQLQPQRRPIRAGGFNEGVRAARALERAFGVGVEFAGDTLARRAEKFSLAGQRAAIEGREPTPEELQQDAFMRGFNEITTDRELVELEGQAQELYSKLDVRNLSSEQVATELDNLFQSQYEGIDLEDDLDADRMRQVVPRWQAIEQRFLRQHQEDNAQAVREEMESSIAIAVEHELRTTGTIDLEVRNRQFLEVFGPKNANAQLVATVTSHAIDAGRPELIEELQAIKVWESNAAAPGGITEYNTILRNARIQADARQRELEAASDAEEKEALQAWQTEQEARLVGTIIDGGSVRHKLGDLLDQGFDPARARVLVSFERSVRNDIDGAEVDYRSVETFQIDMYREGFNTADGINRITTMAEAGQLGSGNARLQLVNTFVSRLGQLESARLRDPKFSGLLAQLDAEYTASNVMERLDPRYRQQRTKAMALMSELVGVQGMNADDAFTQVMQTIPKITQDSSEGGLRAVLPLVLNGSTNPAVLTQFKPEGVALPDYIQSLEDEFGITFTTEQLRQLTGEQ